MVLLHPILQALQILCHSSVLAESTLRDYLFAYQLREVAESLDTCGIIIIILKIIIIN